MPPLWDGLGKAANLAQLFGLHMITLIGIATWFLRFHENKKECRRLQERVRMLQALLQWPRAAQRCPIAMQQRHPDLDHLVAVALRDAHDLVQCYEGSTLWFRVRMGRGMTRRFRDLRNSVDSCCGLVLSVNTCLIILQANQASPYVSVQVSDGDVPSSTGPSTDEEASTDTDDGIHVISINEC